MVFPGARLGVRGKGRRLAAKGKVRFSLYILKEYY